MFATTWLTAEEVEQARVRAYRDYYYRPGFIVGEALKVRRMADIKRLVRGANSVRARLRFFREANEKQEQTTPGVTAGSSQTG